MFFRFLQVSAFSAFQPFSLTGFPNYFWPGDSGSTCMQKDICTYVLSLERLLPAAVVAQLPTLCVLQKGGTGKRGTGKSGIKEECVRVFVSRAPQSGGAGSEAGRLCV